MTTIPIETGTATGTGITLRTTKALPAGTTITAAVRITHETWHSPRRSKLHNNPHSHLPAKATTPTPTPTSPRQLWMQEKAIGERVPLPLEQKVALSRSLAVPFVILLSGFSTAELQKKLSALAMSENPTGQKPPAAAAAAAPPPPPPAPAQQKAAKSNENQKRQTKGQPAAQSATAAEEGIHTSKRSRNPNSSSVEPPQQAQDPPKQTVARGTVSNKITKPSGRGDTLRQAVEAKKS
jgi:hypothetical protein